MSSHSAAWGSGLLYSTWRRFSSNVPRPPRSLCAKWRLRLAPCGRKPVRSCHMYPVFWSRRLGVGFRALYRCKNECGDSLRGFVLVQRRIWRQSSPRRMRSSAFSSLAPRTSCVLPRRPTESVSHGFGVLPGAYGRSQAQLTSPYPGSSLHQQPQPQPQPLR
jgi:hypothetical protein